MKLIIVESPTKGATIKKFLGKDYLVASSYGHIRDLPQKELAVDVENNFQPRYVVPSKAKKRISELKKHLEKAETATLATDEDREGEAIAWHLKEVLKLKEPKRIVFHEITKEAIEKALKNPRKIDINLVNAQQARRVLDRLVGYKLSPFLWKKVLRGLSAGRVQSVAVRLICEREEEIEKFKPQEYWSIEALLKQQIPNPKFQTAFKAILIKQNDRVIPKLGIANKKEAEGIIKDLESAEYKIADIEKKQARRNPLPPFTTSTLQQTAAGKLGFGAKRTMVLAQQLYERGFITYHRTDSFNLSAMSKAAAKAFIEENFGKEYSRPSSYKTKNKSAQEAHEAIRPAYPKRTPQLVKNKLYELIWQRFMASQMSPAVFDAVGADIQAKNYTFRANGQTLKFDGFLRVYPMSFSENELPELVKDEIVDLKKLIPEQHFTQPPPRYSEASLIKTLEKEGIGRPSTYAPILETIQGRNYAIKNQSRYFEPTQIGRTVNGLLVEHFPNIVDVKFTAKMEKELDEIAKGKDTYLKTLKDFYIPFAENLKNKEKTVAKKNMTEKTNKKCPQCGGQIVIRLGRFGKFLACSNFPNCKYTEPLPAQSLGIKCPKCGQGEIVEKRSKKGRVFYGCKRWPNCDFALWNKPINENCPKCGALLTEKNKKIVCSSKECAYERNN